MPYVCPSCDEETDRLHTIAMPDGRVVRFCFGCTRDLLAVR